MLEGHIPEVLIILALAVLFLGPKRLPEAGKSLGQAFRSFRHETQGIRNDIAAVKEQTQSVKQEIAGVTSTVHESVIGAATAPATATSEETVSAQ